MAHTYSIGVDLGTSRSAIMTSEGRRAATRTCVGYPRDVIARKRLQKDFLAGDEALANRLALDLVWPLADGVVREDERAMEATGLILKHLIDRHCRT
jgi:rod shape-determining protein MreB